MKKKRIGLITAILVLTFAMTGCGTQLYEMTEEEQKLIVDYSAYVLAKHNIYQQDGMTSATESQETETESDTPETESEESKSDTASDGSTSTGGSSQASSQEVASVSIAKAIGYDSLSVTYDGVSKADTYKEGDYYSMEAGAGKQYAIMKFTISNTSGADADVDLFNNARTYTAKFSDDKDYPAEGTFLTYSLTTYQGTLKAGESVDVVLLFKIPADTACDNVTLSVFKDNVKNLVEL